MAEFKKAKKKNGSTKAQYARDALNAGLPLADKRNRERKAQQVDSVSGGKNRIKLGNTK